MYVKSKSKFIITTLLFTMLINSGCSWLAWTKSVPPVVQAPIQAVVLKIVFAAGSAAVQVAAEELIGVKIDTKAFEVEVELAG